MTSDDERIGLTLDLGRNTQVVADLRKEIEFLHERLAVLGTEFKAGNLTNEQYLDSTNLVTDALKERTTVLKSLGEKTTSGGLEETASALFKIERIGNALGTGSGLARAGPMLESVVSTLGGPAGLGIAIGALAYALESVLPKLEKFFDVFDEAAVKAASEATKALADQVERLKNLQTSEQKKTKAGIEEFLAEGPAGDVLKGIRAALYKRSARMGRIPEEGEIEEQAKELFAGMAGDPTMAHTVGILAAEQPGDFPTGFASGLASFTPEAEAATDRDLEEAEAFGERAHAGGVGRRRFAAEYNQRRALMEKNLDKATNQAISNEDSLERQEKQEAAQAKHQAALDLREQQKADRDMDPSHRLRAEEARDKDAVDAEVLRQWQAGGKVETGAQLAKIAADAIRALPDYGKDIAAAVQAAAAGGYARGHEDLSNAMQRSQVWSDGRFGNY